VHDSFLPAEESDIILTGAERSEVILARAEGSEVILVKAEQSQRIRLGMETQSFEFSIMTWLQVEGEQSCATLRDYTSRTRRARLILTATTVPSPLREACALLCFSRPTGVHENP